MTMSRFARYKWWLLLLPIAVLLVAAVVVAQESVLAPARQNIAAAVPKVEPAPERAIDYAAFDARLQQLMEKPPMVGLAVGVVEDGEIAFLKGYGTTEYEGGTDVGVDTVFRWASVSKGVAGTLAAKMNEAGEIDLSAPIASYSETLWLPEGAQRIATVRDVLSHRLGLWRNAYDDRLEEGQDPRLIRRQLGGLTQICEPGTCWSYQNIAFDAITEAVETASGTPYRQKVQDSLFVPLGMRSASMTMDGLMATENWARPHSRGRRVLEVTEPYYRVPAAGGVNSDIADMATWLQAQMGNYPDVIDEAALADAHKPLVATAVENRRMRDYRERLKDARYGLGWRTYDYAGHSIVGHRGGLNGYRALIMFDPARDFGVVALWNSNSSRPTGLQFELLDMLYDLPARDWMKLDD